ncbi:hypothetical protein [Fulvivirga lutimaris]|uniref:hypothetical protein n=1 Tax=Fulvivirga lutimaris TaxID=1819566 RepID=UPI0012BCE4BB|nr:hypothetical protein [Fulvivirga lutimaris]MTI39861.1 hypothetical protein [Fulvivirga lutimaris]
MKTRLLSILALVFLSFFSSCSKDDDEPAPPHEVGSWNLVNYALLNVPSDYSYNEGRSFDLDEISLGIEKYELNLEADLTFSRKVNFSGVIPSQDAGTWVLEDEELILTSEDSSDDEVFSIEKNEDDDLWIYFPIQFGLIKNSVIDTLTSEYVNSLTNEEYNDLFDPVNLDFVFLLERNE